MPLDDLIEVRDSPIHGKGVFCRTAIKKNAFIGEYESVPTDEDGIYVLWVEEEDGTENGFDGIGDLRFLNHSYTPNAELDGIDLYALRNIKPGEELFIDYQWDPADEEEILAELAAEAAEREAIAAAEAAKQKPSSNKTTKARRA